MPTRRRRRASLSATRVDVGVCVFLTFGASSRCPWADRSRDRFPLKEGYRKHNGIVRAGVQADDGRKGVVCWAHAAGYREMPTRCVHAFITVGGGFAGHALVTRGH